MRNSDSNNCMNQYAGYAIGAAKAERQGRYADAEELWSKAQMSPCDAIHHRWAMVRRAFCVSADSKGWSNPNAG